MNLETLANISQIANATTIVGGIVFGLMQLSEYRKQRRDSVAAELMRAFMSPELGNATALIRALPDGVSADEFRRHGPETERAAVTITMTFEAMGLLVLELTGGIIVVMWHKLDPWMSQVRAEQSQPSWAEWFNGLRCSANDTRISKRLPTQNIVTGCHDNTFDYAVNCRNMPNHGCTYLGKNLQARLTALSLTIHSSRTRFVAACSIGPHGRVGLIQAFG